ncbi:HEAT repeat domain-containing protein [Ferroacidibacillus organovorans]|uniref:DNA alkylation repair protein n=1 Tax=Ferroacidibacillus organovorans TaxID=1765683 RepID=A0A853KDL9_9BACL|nr:HEAT repeat domain-containing protein [Ferroacidibacillus organovorans]KYP79481.1 hypothetical protein AYJ22_04225 [Ferroacidibacillus organovorans]OAG94531.1 hypothetical protein AYW79_04950 [Ferroacidibacillus organovorans]
MCGADDWCAKFEEAVVQESIFDMIESLQTQATTHAGTANAAAKRMAIKEIERHFSLDAEGRFRVGLALCRSGNHTAEEVGAYVLSSCYAEHQEEVANVLHKLADHTNWEVREWVADACGRILAAHFDRFYPTMQMWTADPSDKVRRAVALAAMYAGHRRIADHAPKILDLIEALLPDRAVYVRENLGPFALGSGLIRDYPIQVLDRLDHWIEIDDEQVRWNLAMIFSAANGAKYAVAAKHVLALLEADSRPYVQKAVTKAIKNLRKRCKEYFIAQKEADF